MTESDDIKLANILVGVDDSDDAQLAFKTAIHRAKEEDAKLTIVSILESDEVNVFQALTKDYVHGERKELETHLLEYKEIAENEGVKDVMVVIGEGEPGETIVHEIIPAVRADLLIIGSLAKKGVSKYFGSQAAYMAKHAPISVYVVR
ncbi:universal stress protein [Dellaglioa sp. BT-FLS60]